MSFKLLSQGVLATCLITSSAFAKNSSRNIERVKDDRRVSKTVERVNLRDAIINFKYSIDDAGREVVRVVGSGLQSAERFRIRVTDTLDGDSGWYTSESGKQEWSITSGGKINMQISKDIFQPGKIIEVRLYDADQNGKKIATFTYAIPCAQTELITIFTNGFDLVFGEITINNCSGGGSSVVVVAPAPAQPVQHCSSLINASTTSAQVSYQCDMQDDVDVTVIDKTTGQTVCLERFKSAISDMRPACAIPRNSVKTMNLDVQIDSRNGRFTQNHIVAKDATFTSAPKANILSGKENFVSATSGLIVDKKWNVTIKAQVFDVDVNRDEGRSLIKVDLVHKVNGSLYFLRRGLTANTGDVVSFNLEKTYSKPGFFSSGGEGGDNLNMGRNEIFVRVHDAYSIDEMKFVDIPVIVNLQ